MSEQWWELTKIRTGMLGTSETEHLDFNPIVRIAALEAKIADLESIIKGMRPVWNQGFTDENIAAQVNESALAQLWELLGAENQTEAVQRLKELKAELAAKRFTVEVEVPEPCFSGGCSIECPLLRYRDLTGWTCLKGWGMRIKESTLERPGPDCPRYEGEK